MALSAVKVNLKQWFKFFVLSDSVPIIRGSKYTIACSVPIVGNPWVYFADSNPYPGGSNHYLNSSDLSFRTFTTSVADALAIIEGKAKTNAEAESLCIAWCKKKGGK